MDGSLLSGNQTVVKQLRHDIYSSQPRSGLTQEWFLSELSPSRIRFIVQRYESVEMCKISRKKPYNPVFSFSITVHRTSTPETFASQGLPASEPTSLASSLSDKHGSLSEVGRNVSQPTSILSQQHSPAESVTSNASPPPSPKVTFMTKI